MGNGESSEEDLPEFDEHGVKIEYADGYLEARRAERSAQRAALAQQQQDEEGARKPKKKKNDKEKCKEKKKKKEKAKKKKGKSKDAQSASEGSDSDSEADTVGGPPAMALPPVPPIPSGPLPLPPTVVSRHGDPVYMEPSWAEEVPGNSFTDTEDEDDLEQWETDMGSEDEFVDQDDCADAGVHYDPAFCYTAIFSYVAEHETELSFQAGDIVTVAETAEGWWRGISGGADGWFPATYVTPTPHRFEPPSDYDSWLAQQATSAAPYVSVLTDQALLTDHQADGYATVGDGYGEQQWCHKDSVDRTAGDAHHEGDNKGAYVQDTYSLSNYPASYGPESHVDGTTDGEQHHYFAEQAHYQQQAWPADSNNLTTGQHQDFHAGYQEQPEPGKSTTSGSSYLGDESYQEQHQVQAHCYDASLSPQAYDRQQESVVYGNSYNDQIWHQNLQQQQQQQFNEADGIYTETRPTYGSGRLPLAEQLLPHTAYVHLEDHVAEGYRRLQAHESEGQADQQASLAFQYHQPLPVDPAYTASTNQTYAEPFSSGLWDYHAYETPLSLVGVGPVVTAPSPQDRTTPAGLDYPAPGLSDGLHISPYHVTTLSSAMAESGAVPSDNAGVVQKSVNPAGRALMPSAAMSELSKALGAKPQFDASKLAELDAPKSSSAATAREGATTVRTLGPPPPKKPKPVPGSAPTSSDEGMDSTVKQALQPPGRLEVYMGSTAAKMHSSMTCSAASVVVTAVQPIAAVRRFPSVGLPATATEPLLPSAAVLLKRHQQQQEDEHLLPAHPESAVSSTAGGHRSAPPSPRKAETSAPPKQQANLPSATEGKTATFLPMQGKAQPKGNYSHKAPPPPPPVAKSGPGKNQDTDASLAATPTTESLAVTEPDQRPVPIKKAPPPPAGVTPARKAPPPPAGAQKKKRRRARLEAKASGENGSSRTRRPPPPTRSVPLPPSRPVPQPPSVLAAQQGQLPAEKQVDTTPSSSSPEAALKALKVKPSLPSTKPVVSQTTVKPPIPETPPTIVLPNASENQSLAPLSNSKPAAQPRPGVAPENGVPKPKPKPRHVGGHSQLPSEEASALITPSPGCLAAPVPKPKPKPKPRLSETKLTEMDSMKSKPPPRPAAGPIGAKPALPTAKPVGTTPMSAAADLTQPKAPFLSKSVQVRRAMTSHKAAKTGELSFKEGEVLVQMSDPDAKGMCRGMLQNGVMGIYPADKVAKF